MHVLDLLSVQQRKLVFQREDERKVTNQWWRRNQETSPSEEMHHEQHEPMRGTLIVSGPGTGKTFTLVSRLVHLLRRPNDGDDDCDDDEVLVLTSNSHQAKFISGMVIANSSLSQRYRILLLNV